MAIERVFLIGLSGSGKTTVGKLLAQRLGWDCLDSDAEIEAEAGIGVETIFRDEGESSFREREAEVLERLARRSRVVVATGGGAPIHPRSRAALATGLVVWLDVTPEQAARRLAGDPNAAVRPLLNGDPVAGLERLFGERRHLYEKADHSVAVDYYTPQQVAERIAAIVDTSIEAGWVPEATRLVVEIEPRSTEVAAIVTTPTARYPVYVVRGGVSNAGSVCRDLGLGGRAFVLSDTAIASLYGSSLRNGLASAGYEARAFEIPAGEQNKTLATVSSIYDWLLSERVERSDFLICLGGGVVTDLGGFAAATILRGIEFVHVPTTMLGMVDASVGGKTGVDHPLGKNMVGAFAQPRAVVIDPDVLSTLPEREVRAGCAELVKHGFILDEVLVRDLEAANGDLAVLTSSAMIGRSVAIKAAVVSGDEREAGQRSLLNYGHTLGHAIEAVTGYDRFLHGEAVALGMRAAGLISVGMGMLSEDEFARQQALLRRCGLPERAEGVALEAVLDATLSDKKVRGGRVRWVLLERIGRATTRADVPSDLVRQAAEAVLC